MKEARNTSKRFRYCACTKQSKNYLQLVSRALRPLQPRSAVGGTKKWIERTCDMLIKCPVTCCKEIQNNNLWNIVTAQWQQIEENKIKIRALRSKLGFSFLHRTLSQTLRDIIKQRQLLYTIVNCGTDEPEVNQRDKHHPWQTSCKRNHDWLKFASEWLIILLVINNQTLKSF